MHSNDERAHGVYEKLYTVDTDRRVGTDKSIGNLFYFIKNSIVL